MSAPTRWAHFAKAPISRAMALLISLVLDHPSALRGKFKKKKGNQRPENLLGNFLAISGPAGRGESHYESNRIIGQNQADMAIQLFMQDGVSLDGPVDYRQKYWDITKEQVRTPAGDIVTPCPPAMVNSREKFKYSFIHRI